MFLLDKNSQRAFEDLKRDMTCSPVLIPLNFPKRLIVQTDALGKGTGAVQQEHGPPMAYYSNKLCSKLPKFVYLR